MMDLLLAVLGHGDVPPLRDLEPHEWVGLQEAACEHRVAPLLRHRLQERGEAEHVPAAVERRLSDLHVVGVLRAEARRLQLAEILAALGPAHVPVVLLKGAFLAEHVYPSAALRPMGDLDLLVPTTAFDAAVEALVAVGYPAPDAESWVAYRHHRHVPPLRRRGYLTVELHTRIEPCVPPLRLPLADVWKRARPVQSGGDCALALAPDDVLLHLATHMGRSHLLGASLVSLCDVAAWLAVYGTTADWDAIVRRSREGDVRRFVSAALGLSDMVLATRTPPEVRRALHSESDDAVIARAIEVLRWPRRFPADPLALLDLRVSWMGAHRVLQALVVNPVRRWRGTADAGAAYDAGSASMRWAAAARFLLDSSSRRAIRHQSAGIEELRQWALED